MTTPAESAMDEHRMDLANVAAALAANCSKLLRHDGKVIGNVIDGGTLWLSEYTISENPETSDRDNAIVLERVDEILARSLLVHLAGEFPEMTGIGDWRGVTRDNLSDAIVGVLGIAARRRMFLGDCDICRSLAQHESKPDTGIRTQDVIDDFMKHKKHKRLKQTSLYTYEKHLAQFERTFPWLPGELPPIMEYLDQFDGETGRAKRNQQDIVNMLYKHAVRHFGLASNPMNGLERPLVTKKPIKTITKDQACAMDKTPETPVERIALDMLLGHGWRQVEVRRITVGDVTDIKDGLIWCWGKERNEWTPVLPETEQRLREMSEGRQPEEAVILGHMIGGGRRQPMGEDGMRKLVKRLYARAGIERMTGHDLRRTFTTLVTESSGDEFLAMRLIRDKVPGLSDRYVNYPMTLLKQGLIAHSPLSGDGGDSVGDGGERQKCMVETGESRTLEPIYAMLMGSPSHSPPFLV